MGDIRITKSSDHVVQITIDRPDFRNAFDEPLIELWVERLTQVASDAPRAVVLTGEGEVFCAGYDIRSIDPDQDLALPLPDTRFERVIHALAALPCPVIAGLSGDAFGGGFDLALACDFRVAWPQVKLAMTPCRLGLVYGLTGVARLLAVLGGPLTRRMLLSGLPLPAIQAENQGILELVSTRQDVLAAAHDLAARIADNAPLAVRGARQAISLLEGAMPLHLSAEALARTEEQRIQAFGSADLREGLAAFAQKRQPRFQGL